MIEVPAHCKRLVSAYQAAGYTVVESGRSDLLRMELGFSGAPPSLLPAPQAIYILVLGRQPLSLLNRDPNRPYIRSTGNPVSRNRNTANRK